MRMSSPFQEGYVAPPSKDSDNMADPAPKAVEVVEETAHLPITVTINVDALIKSELGWTPWPTGYDDDGEPDYDEPNYRPGGNGKIIDIVTDKLAARLQSETKTAVREAVKEVALAKVDALMDEIMAEKLVLTNSLGEVQGSGEALTLRESMIKAMTDRLESRVDDNGKPLTNQRFGNDRGFSYIAWHADRAARLVLDKELVEDVKTAVKEIRDKTKAAVSAKVAAMLSAAL
jgi:hypothetical protein